MSDTMTLRDHSKPCEHVTDDVPANLRTYLTRKGFWECPDGACPGGKEIILRRPQRYWHEGTDVDGDTSTWFVPVSSFDAKVLVVVDDE